MFIMIAKIITEYKKDALNNPVKDPTSGEKIPDGFKISNETIRLDEIKSARPWHKSPHQEKYIKGDVCAIYMLDIDRSKEKGAKVKPSEIHINESHESFSKRMKAIGFEI